MAVGLVRFVGVFKTRLLGYIVDEKILVLFNSDSTNDGFENIYLPEKNGLKK